MTPQEHFAVIEDLEEQIEQARSEYVASQRNADGTYPTVEKSHYVTIDTRYGETTRECFCALTGGRSHHEDDYPWITSTRGKVGV